MVEWWWWRWGRAWMLGGGGEGMRGERRLLLPRPVLTGRSSLSPPLIPRSRSLLSLPAGSGVRPREAGL